MKDRPYLSLWYLLTVAMIAGGCSSTGSPVPSGSHHPADPAALEAPGLTTAVNTLNSDAISAPEMPAMDHSQHRMKK